LSSNSECGLVIYNFNDNFASNNNFYFNGLYGLRIYSSGNDNVIYHNYFNNINNANDPYSNIWDNGYPSAGNFWSDYTGVDADGDFIGDTPYNISGGSNQDLNPLMYPDGFISELDSGWNLVSVPFLGWIDKNYITVIGNNSIYSWSEAVNNGVILEFVYYWDSNMQQYLTTDILSTGYGYWMYAYYNCTLLRT